MQRGKVIVIGVCVLLLFLVFGGCISVPLEGSGFAIVSFDVEPNIITQGEFANLSWVVINGSSVNIDNGIGNVALTGQRIIQPMQTTTYILTASNATTTKSASTRIVVKPTPQSPPETPVIRCSVDNVTNRIMVESINIKVRWRDIEITTSPPASWQVQDANYEALAKPDTTATISTNVTVGDNILVFGTSGNVTVALKYRPTDTFLGRWTVDV